MGHKIFISYKYGDSSVQHLSRNYSWETTRVRDYVDELQDKLSYGDHINKGEEDGEDLSRFKDSTIESHLRDKIYDSSITIVLISPNMKEEYKSENDQWIPWEISYSLRESTRKGRTSKSNAMLAVVLPDKNGSYDYMLENLNCCSALCTLNHTYKLFSILRSNMFNRKNDSGRTCDKGDKVYNGDFSYIKMIRWDAFIPSIDFWIEEALRIQADKESYEIRVNVQ